MRATLPEVVTRYFELDARRDVDAVTALFTEDARVIDDGQAYEGVAAIRSWRTGPVAKYTYTTAILDAEAVGGGKIVVTVRLTGNFPGGAVLLQQHFTLAGDRICGLVITP